MLAAALLLIHLVSFAAYLGAGFGQLQMMKRSRAAGIAPAVRDELERLSAAIATKIELPAIIGSIASGIGFITQNPVLMKQGWLHGKLLCVLLLLILSHMEMFNARKIVRARATLAGEADKTVGPNPLEVDIERRKKRHETFGGIGALLVVALVVLVTFVRLS